MGRHKTGKWTIYESFRIDISYLIRMGYLKRGYTVNGIVISWQLKGTEEVTSSLQMNTSWGCESDTTYIELIYQYRTSSVLIPYSYRIYIQELDSNIGKGKVPYFICPTSNRRCRILYRAYDSHVFRSRYGYSLPLYYDCQRTSKLERPMNCFYLLEDHIDKLKSKGTGHKRVYRGIPTKAAQRLRRLKNMAHEKDMERWKVFENYSSGRKLKFS